MIAAKRAAPMIAPPDEDPNVLVLCSSPPCFMHELDPSYLGYLGRDEVTALLSEAIRMEWPGTLLEAAWLRAMLRRRLAALGAPAPRTASGADDAVAMRAPDCLATRLRDALPRLCDHGLREDLRHALGMLERNKQSRGARRDVTPAGQRWDEVRRWRQAQRKALIARRLDISSEQRTEWNALITAGLESRLAASEPRLVGFYWPFKGEYDPRPLMRVLRRQGIRVALPVVIERAQPLVFREWSPGIRMAPGIWDIPVPAEGEAVEPDVLVVPLVGFDEAGFRLGFGGGYYDRTLAAMAAQTLNIGVGFELALLDTIHPQPHDIPMRAIVTEARTIGAADLPPVAQARDGHGEMQT